MAFEEDFFVFIRSLDFFSQSKIPCNLKQEEEPRLLNRLLYVNKTVINTYENRKNFQLKKKKDYFIFIIQR
jgi:hypothetical protein